MRANINCGDVLEFVRKVEDNTFHGSLTDPPYGNLFMGQNLGWDEELPSVEVFRELFRVTKPGGYLLCFGHSKTLGPLWANISEAGWEIVDMLLWLFSHRPAIPAYIDKQIDARLGVTREIIGPNPGWRKRNWRAFGESAFAHQTYLSRPATPLAKRFDGYGNRLRSRYDPIILAMKPYAGTYAENALTHGVAGLNIGACRIPAADKPLFPIGYDSGTVYGSFPRIADEHPDMTTVYSTLPRYCRHKASGQAYVWVNKKRHYLGVFGSAESKERYSRFIAELAVNPIPSSPPAKEEITIVELCAAYLEYAQGYYVKNGRPSDHIGTVKRGISIVIKLYGDVSAIQFGPLAYRAIQNAFVAQNLSRSTINSTGASIRRMFKWAASHELLPVSVFQSLATVPGLKAGRTNAREPAPILPVVDTVIDATLPFLPVVVADMVRFQRLTGSRPGEVCQLRPMDIDLNGEVWEYRPASHKTQHHSKSRIIYIGPQAQAILASYLERPAETFCFSPAESETMRHVEMRTKRKTRVQPSQQHRRKSRPKRVPRTFYDRDGYRRAITRAVEKANKRILADAEHFGIEAVLLPHWHPNQLRHSAATKIRKQFGLEAAQVILGHSKADVTQIYAERDAAKAIDVIKQIG